MAHWKRKKPSCQLPLRLIPYEDQLRLFHTIRRLASSSCQGAPQGHLQDIPVVEVIAKLNKDAAHAKPTTFLSSAAKLPCWTCASIAAGLVGSRRYPTVSAMLREREINAWVGTVGRGERGLISHLRLLCMVWNPLKGKTGSTQWEKKVWLLFSKVAWLCSNTDTIHYRSSYSLHPQISALLGLS
jgi:hypothetical protein